MSEGADPSLQPAEIIRGLGRRTVVRVPAGAFGGFPPPASQAVVAAATEEHVDLIVSPALRMGIAARHALLSDARHLAAASLIAAERGQHLWDVDVALALGADPTDEAVKEWRVANGVPKPPASWPKGWTPSSRVIEQARAVANGLPVPERRGEEGSAEDDLPHPVANPLGGLTPGDILGGYRIEHVLGQGGMGVVYSAFEDNLNRRVALKVIVPHVADNAETRQRFIREARTAASIEHPHAVPIHAIGDADGLLYIAMRQIAGPTLNGVIAREVYLEPVRAVRIIEQVADVLDAAHEAGIVHRDVKPQNILLGTHGQLEHAYLSDFGLARLMQDTGLTRTGGSLGTPSYMAPEQVRGDKEITPAADTYSLGCVLFECLTGVTPYARDSSHAVMFAHLNDEPPKASATNTQSPAALDQVIERALAKAPGQRFESAGAFARAARRALDTANLDAHVPETGDEVLVEALRKLVALGERGDYFAKAIVLTVDDTRNYYIQFAVDEGGLFCEVVHNKYLAPEHAFTGDEIATLLALGFEGPDYEDQNLVRAFEPRTDDDYVAIVQIVRTVVTDYFGLPPGHPLVMRTEGLDG